MPVTPSHQVSDPGSRVPSGEGAHAVVLLGHAQHDVACDGQVISHPQLGQRKRAAQGSRACGSTLSNDPTARRSWHDSGPFGPFFALLQQASLSVPGTDSFFHLLMSEDVQSLCVADGQNSPERTSAPPHRRRSEIDLLLRRGLRPPNDTNRCRATRCRGRGRSGTPTSAGWRSAFWLVFSLEPHGTIQANQLAQARPVWDCHSCRSVGVVDMGSVGIDSIHEVPGVGLQYLWPPATLHVQSWTCVFRYSSDAFSRSGSKPLDHPLGPKCFSCIFPPIITVWYPIRILGPDTFTGVEPILTWCSRVRIL